MSTPNNPIDNLLAVIADLSRERTQLLAIIANAEADAGKYKSYWLEDSKELAEVKKQLETFKTAKTHVKPCCAVEEQSNNGIL